MTKQSYSAIKIWDNKHTRYIVCGYKQEWEKLAHAKNAALNYWYEEYRFKDKQNGWESGIPFKDQKRFEVHEVMVTFEKKWDAV